MMQHSCPSTSAAGVWRRQEVPSHAGVNAAIKEYWVGEALAAAGLAAAFFAAAVAILAGSLAHGLVAAEGMFDLSGRAVMAAEGRMPVLDALMARPPLPLFVTLPFAYAAPGGMQPAVLASAFVATLFATVLFQNFRYRGYSQITAFAAVMLLTANPLTLHALVSGPGAMLMLFMLFVLANAAIGVTNGRDAHKLVVVGGALVLLAAAHPFGFLVAVAALPGLSFAIPRSFLLRESRRLTFALLFPLGFVLAAFLYARGDVMSIPAAGGNPPNVGAAIDFGTAAARATIAAVVGAPLVAAFIVWTYRRIEISLAAVALVGVVVGAALLQIVYGHSGGSAVMLAGSLPVASACALHAPNTRLHQLYVCVLLVAGALAGGLIITAYAGPAPRAAAVVAAGEMRTALAQIRDIIQRREGVLMDAEGHPALVAALGTARGLVMPGQAAFDAQIHSRRLTSEFVVVTRPGTGETSDRIAENWPDFYDHGAPGYQLVYDRAGWRVYARLSRLSLVAQ